MGTECSDLVNHGQMPAEFVADDGTRAVWGCQQCGRRVQLVKGQLTTLAEGDPAALHSGPQARS